MKNPIFLAAVTEKTDGFSFEIGHDLEGFFVRSASSPKIRKTGEFTQYCYSKHPFDIEKIMIPLRLELAFNLVASNDGLVKWLREQKVAISGEMFLLIDRIPYAPRGTKYSKLLSFHSGLQGVFVIHTRMNPLLSHRNINDLIAHVHFEAMKIDSDVPNYVKDVLSFETKGIDTISKLEDIIRSRLQPFRSNWGDFGAEGFVVHYSSDIRFKVMKDAKVENDYR
jgi:hypothetical protein